jgi:hypothetical protein
MTMATIVRRRGWLAIVGVFAVGVLLSGCPSATNKEKADRQPTKTDVGSVAADQHRGAAVPAAAGGKNARAANSKKSTKKEPLEEKVAQEVEQMAEKPRDIGPPLVDQPENLTRLNPQQLIWVDLPDKQVVLQGEVCRAGYPLEFFATYGNRSYEAVVAVNVKPSIVHAGLLRVGAEAGHPARFQPEFAPPTGTEVAIEVRWKDAQGKVQSCPAQHWIRNIKTRKELDSNWVFGGSLFVTDETTGKEYYQADSGELICVLSSPTAMLDLPMQGYGAIEARSFEAFAEHLPPEGTPVTILLKPILSAKPAAPAGKEAAPTKHAAAEQKAVAAAEAWLALADKEQYLQCWETAAGYLMNHIERREFVKQISEARKPLGKVVSRQLESKWYTTELPDAPNGQYVVLQYKTSFEHHKSAIETITPMLDKDRKWRVSGYYIR